MSFPPPVYPSLHGEAECRHLTTEGHLVKGARGPEATLGGGQEEEGGDGDGLTSVPAPIVIHLVKRSIWICDQFCFVF